MLAGMAACSPITGRQARLWESGRKIETDARARAASEALAGEAAELPSPQREVLATAFDLLGAPRSELDCSAFVARAWSAAGVELPRTVREQLRVGSEVTGESPQPGDLVFFAFASRPADHVGLYAGRGQILHVSSAAGSVQLAPLAEPPFAGARVAVRRPGIRAARSEPGA
jgi:cell wall-associated NlpC family hydrolase